MAALVTTAQAVEQRVNLPDGNYVTVDLDYDLPGETPVENVGMVRWYDSGGNLLTYLHGSMANDQTGSGGITWMNGWGILVRSPLWDNAGVADAGAMTIIVPSWAGDAPPGAVSASNSMVGSSAGDQVGSGDVTLMDEGVILVCSPLWDNAGAANAGAVTIMTSSAAGGASTGVVSATNSLVGSSTGDQIGSGGVNAVGELNVLVRSPLWDNAGVADAGALTIMSPPGAGSGVSAGAVSATHSLVGSSAGDQIGSGGVTAVNQWCVLVHNPFWDNGGVADAGAVTIFMPMAGMVPNGAVSATNSLVGSSAGDQIGSGGVTVLNEFSVLVHSPLWDNSGATDAGAVTIFILVSDMVPKGAVSATNSLVGSSAGDQIGSGGVTAVDELSFLVHSPLWDNSGATNAGAVTIMAPALGILNNGAVSATTSLVGSSAGDQIGSGGITVLGGFHVLVHSPLWDSSGATDAGAVTILAPAYGIDPKGAVSATNSLVGASAGDQVGSGGIIVLDELRGNEVKVLVHSPLWDNNGVADAGAVTFIAPSLGIIGKGTVSATNSLVGSSAGDQVGSGGSTVLDEFNFLVRSPLWDNSGAADAGAVTVIAPRLGFGHNGAVSVTNSLVGSSAGDQIGSGGVTSAKGLGCLILSPLWDKGATANAGAVTMGVYGIPETLIGIVSATNSLVGGSAHDQVGSGGATVLGSPEMPLGFVIRSPLWDNGSVADAGALTLGGFSWEPPSLVGTVSTSNSLVGASPGDDVGSGGVIPCGFSVLVFSPLWDNGTAGDAGAVTSFPLFTGPRTVGVISYGNSLVGSSPDDRVGSGGITQFGLVGLVIHSPLWDNGTAVEAGAITVIDGSPGMPPPTGVISSANSLVGSSANDRLGSGGITPLGSSNESFILRSPLWDNGLAADAGAVTVVTPVFHTGTLSAVNSLVGSSTNDQVGSGGITPLGSSNESFVLRSPLWDNGLAADAGAVTMVTPVFHTGTISAANSMVGLSANDQVGSSEITLLGSSNESFVLRSPLWDNGPVADAGAVTVVTPAFHAGTVSIDNSMVGFSANDQVGSGGIARVGTDSFVVASPQWDDGTVVNAGAATFGGLHAPFKGPVFALNSIVGSAANDQVGSGGVWAATSTIGLVNSPLWDHRTAIDAGAVTWMSGSDLALSRPVTKYNSLVGSHSNDQIGSGGITVQPTDPVVIIRSPNWCYGAGATTSLSTMPFNGIVSWENSVTGGEHAQPEFALLQPAPVEVAAGSLQSFGNVGWGGSRSLTFTVKNKGTDDLVLYNGGSAMVALTGMDRSQFSLVSDVPWETVPFPFSRPLVLVAGDSASFSVKFSPSSTGTKTATLSVYPYTGPFSSAAFSVSLRGTADALGVADWRQTHFGSSANTGEGADNADFDRDGIPNLVEYALGLHPGQSTAGQLPLPVRTGGNFSMSFTEPNSVAGIIYGAEWSTSLAAGSWQPVTDTGTAPQHVFSVPIGGNTKIFMRLKVTPTPSL